MKQQVGQVEMLTKPGVPCWGRSVKAAPGVVQEQQRWADLEVRKAVICLMATEEAMLGSSVLISAEISIIMGPVAWGCGVARKVSRKWCSSDVASPGRAASVEGAMEGG